LKLLRKLAFVLLGESIYLKILQASFFLQYKSGYLRSNYIYKFHYLVKDIIEPDYIVVDIGGNLGYYSKIFSDLVGIGGKVIVVEPVVPYMKAIKAITDARICDYYNNALGRENKTITMSTPKTWGYLRPGLSHIKTDSAEDAESYEYQSIMVKGSEILSNYQKLDYIKIDIEGYEVVVLPEIKHNIEQCRPMIQIESWGESLQAVDSMLKSLDYVHYIYIDEKLEIKGDLNKSQGDILYLPKEKVSAFENKMKSKYYQFI